jgi:hypothetical protein
MRIGEVTPRMGGFSHTRIRPIVSHPTSIEFSHEIRRKVGRADEVTA